MSNLRARSEVRRFRFTGNDCLFLDPLGRRVVADAEGGGEWRVLRADPPLLVLRGDDAVGAFHGSFSESLSVLAISPGEVEVLISRDLPSSAGTATASPFGAGWVASAAGPISVDGRRESFVAPMPFFRSAAGEGLHVISSPVRLEVVDAWRIDDLAALKSRGWRVQNISKVVELASAFPDGTPHSGPVASHLNAASWRVPLPPNNQGLRLRKTYDRFHGLQRARILVDGVFTGWWYEPVQDRARRWAVAEYGIDEGHTRGKTEIELTVDPPAGSPLWSVSEFEVGVLLEP